MRNLVDRPQEHDSSLQLNFPSSLADFDTLYFCGKKKCHSSLKNYLNKAVTILSNEHKSLCERIHFARSSWIQSFDESVKEEGATKNLKVIVFGREVARLAARVTAVLGSPDSSYTGPENVSEEWTEFFSEGIFSILLSSFVR